MPTFIISIFRQMRRKVRKVEINRKCSFIEKTLKENLTKKSLKQLSHTSIYRRGIHNGCGCVCM